MELPFEESYLMKLQGQALQVNEDMKNGKMDVPIKVYQDLLSTHIDVVNILVKFLPKEIQIGYFK